MSIPTIRTTTSTGYMMSDCLSEEFSHRRIYIIGEITEEQPGKVVMMTEIGTQALLPQPGGELLPRIC